MKLFSFLLILNETVMRYFIRLIRLNFPPIFTVIVRWCRVLPSMDSETLIPPFTYRVFKKSYDFERGLRLDNILPPYSSELIFLSVFITYTVDTIPFLGLLLGKSFVYTFVFNLVKNYFLNYFCNECFMLL